MSANPETTPAATSTTLSGLPKDDPLYRGPGVGVVQTPPDAVAVEVEEAVAPSAAPSAASATTPPAAAPNPAPAPAKEPTLDDKLKAARLSDCSFTYRGHRLVVLHQIDGPSEPAVRIESVVERCWAQPKARRFDVLEFPHFVLAINPQTGKIDYDVSKEIPDGTRDDAIKEHDAKVRDFMAELNGETSKIRELAKEFSALSDDDLYNLARRLDLKKLRKAVDAFHKVIGEAQRSKTGDVKASGEKPAVSGNQPAAKSGEPKPGQSPRPNSGSGQSGKPAEGKTNNGSGKSNKSRHKHNPGSQPNSARPNNSQPNNGQSNGSQGAKSPQRITYADYGWDT